MNTGVHARVGWANVSLRDVTIAQVGKQGLASANDVTHWKRAEDLGRFLKVNKVQMRPASGVDGWLSLARRSHASGLVAGATRIGGGGRWKSQDRKIVPLSPYVEEPLNSKVPEQRSRYVFFEFRDSYVLCIYVMNVPCTFRIFMYMAMVHINMVFIFYSDTEKTKSTFYTKSTICFIFAN